MRRRLIQILLLAALSPGFRGDRWLGAVHAAEGGAAGLGVERTVEALEATAALRVWREAEGRGVVGAGSLERGVALARERAAVMRGLAESDPREFGRLAVSEEERAGYPDEVRIWLERRVAGRGAFAVWCGLPKDGEAGRVAGDEAESGHAGIHREVILDGERYRAFVFGAWEEETSVWEGRIEGIVLDGVIVLGEAPPPRASGDPVTADSPNLSGPNTLLYIIARFSDETTDPIDDATARSQMQTVSTFWMNNSSGVVWLEGLVNVGEVMDIVHVTLPRPRSYGATYNSNFGQLLSDARGEATAAGFHYANYNLDVVVTSDQSFSYAGRAYVGGQGAHLVRPYTTLRTAGHELGHNLGLYHANYWRSDSPHAFGKDTVPGGYVADSNNAEWVEYGHYFSVMGAQGGSEMDDPSKPHYAVGEKVRLGWLAGGAVQYAGAGGTYRLFRHDHGGTTGTPRAIRIDVPATDYTGNARRYWLNYRYAAWNTAQNWFRNGLQIDVARTAYGNDGAVMLDLSPYSKDAATPFYDPANRPGSYWTIDNEDKRDGALLVGRTYSDAGAGIHITPVGVGSNGSGEEYIDVVVQLGQFTGNRPPQIESLQATASQAVINESVSFSVSAADPDGDPLAYAWDFDQTQVWTGSGLNTADATKSWPVAGQYRVVVTVSDMKGGVATESMVITVGSPASTRRIAGRVLWAGQPVYGARVSAVTGSTTAQAFTDSDGTYLLTDLSAAASYTLGCLGSGLTFTAQFTNPVSLSGGDAYGLDFYANEPPVGGGGGTTTTHAVRGRVTDSGAGVPGVEIRGGGKLVVTDGAGSYVLNGFPDGEYTITADRAGWTFSPSSRLATVNGADVTGVDFARATPYELSGRFYNVPAGGGNPAPWVWLSDGRSTVATRAGTGPNRYWTFTLGNVPGGTFSLSAELAGYRFTPLGFTNPVVVSGSRAGLDFDGASADAAGAIAGRILEAGVPRAGVRVEALQGTNSLGSATTDSDGFYRIPDLGAGSYTVQPVAAGYTFTPASRTVESVPASDVDFVAEGTSLPPAIDSVTATPETLASASETSILSATATGAGLLTYEWGAVSAPYPVTFSENNSAGAASTTVSFVGGGDYTFRVRVTDASGLSSVATVGVTVAAGTGSGSGTLVVSPYEVVVPAGQTVGFRADAWDWQGREVPTSPAWSVNGGGTIDGGGVFTAETVGGPYLVTATDGDVSATASVWVSEQTVVLPSVSVTALLASVGEDSGSPATVRLSRTGSTTSALSLVVGLSGTATRGVDYAIAGADLVTASNLVATIPAGSAVKELTVTPISDALGEGDETVTFVITGGAAYTAGSPATTTVMIVDAALPKVSVVAGNGTAAEFGSLTGSFVVSRSGASNGDPLAVRYRLGGSAVNGEDFGTLGGTVTIDAGMASAEVAVVPILDGLAEGDETVELTLDADAAYAMDAATNALVTILDRPVDRWRRGRFDPAEIQDAGISGDAADPDGDGMANLLEYALGMDPKTADDGRVLVAGVSGDRFTISYHENPDAVDVAIEVEAAGELPGGWSLAGFTEVSRVDGGGYWVVTLREDVPVASGVARYFRLRVRLL